MPRKDDPKEMTYRSYNEVEREMLRQVGFEELGLYVVMKELGSFTNGWLGKFHQQKITYARLAQEMHRNASQGRKEKAFDTTAIIRLLVNLEEVGLVTDRQWDGKRLTLFMPFSPMWKGNPERKGVGKSAAGGHEVATKLPRENFASAAEADTEGLPSASLSSSVVSSSEVNRPFLSSVSSGPVPSDAGDGDPENDAPAEPPALTAADIEQALATTGKVLYAHTADSRIFFESWVKKGLTGERLDEALLSCLIEPDPVTPKDLDGELFPRTARQYGRRPQPAVRRRGGVAL